MGKSLSECIWSYCLYKSVLLSEIHAEHCAVLEMNKDELPAFNTPYCQHSKGHTEYITVEVGNLKVYGLKYISSIKSLSANINSLPLREKKESPL